MSNRKPISLDENELPTASELEAQAQAREAELLAQSRAASEVPPPSENFNDELSDAERRLQESGTTPPAETPPSAPGQDVDLDTAVKGARGEPAKPKKVTKAKGAKAKQAKAEAEAKASETTSETTTSAIFASKLSKKEEERLTAARSALQDALSRATPGEPLSIDPEHLLIVGLDIPGTEGDPLYQPERNALAVEERWVAAMQVIGWPAGEPAAVIVRDGAPFCMDARQRTKTAREANKNLRKAKQDPIRARFVVETLGEVDIAVQSAAVNNYGIESSAMMKARECATIYKQTGESLALTATAMNCTEQGVKDYLKMATMSPQLAKFVERDEISASAIIHVLRIPKVEDQVALVSDAVLAGQVSRTQVKGLVKRFLGETDETETDKDAGSKGPAAPQGWEAGTKPKLRFANKVIERVLETVDPETPEGETLDVLVKGFRWLMEGQAPPKLLAGHIRAVNNTLAKAVADGKASNK